MAQLGTKFNAQDHNTEQTDFENLPNGTYELEIESSEVKPNSKGNGTILKITAQVLRPETYAGRKYFDNFNIEHQNTQAQEIGQRQFAQLCRAIGVSEVEDSEELHFRAYMVKIGLGKPSKDGQYAARNEVKKYLYPDEGDLPEPAIDADQPTRGAPANDNKPASNASTARTTQNGGAASSDKPKRPWGGK